jgi:drug/metabolite transporter (DMT)-like permease
MVERTLRRSAIALPPHALALLGLSLASVAWASAFIAGKIVLAEMRPLSVAAWRYALASSLLLPFALRGRNPGPARRATLPLLAMIATGGVLYPCLFLLALDKTSATNTALLVALNPVITLLLSPLVGETLDRGRLCGVAVALAGAVTVITRGDAAVLGDLGSLNAGDLLAIAAACMWAGFNLASRRAVACLSAARTNTLVYGIGGATLFLLARSEAPLVQLQSASPGALGALAVMAVFSSAAAGQLFLFGVRVVGVGRSVVFVYAVPVLTALFSSVLLHETPGASQLAGGAGVIAGLWLTVRGAAPPREAAPAIGKAAPFGRAAT